MSRRGLSQLVFVLLVGASLLASSVSACTCSHHDLDGTAAVGHHDHHASEVERGSLAYLSASDDCICAIDTPRGIAKSENLKIQQPFALAGWVGVPHAADRIILLGAQSNGFEKPSYLTDPFHNLAPKRGPPVS